MAIIQLFADGIMRGTVERTPFFDQARAELLAAGFKPTAWVDYVVKHGSDNQVCFVTIRKDRLAFIVANKHATTKFVSKVVQATSGF